MEQIQASFREILAEEGFQEIVNDQIVRDGQLVFSAVQNLLERYDLRPSQTEEVLKTEKLYSIQQCFRTTDKIFSIIGKEAVATSLTTMMSFFILGATSLDDAFRITIRFYERIGLHPEEITMALSEEMLDQVGLEFRALMPVCLLPCDRLRSTLGSDGTEGEYIKFYFRNATGLIPVGTLNILRGEEAYVIDSSFLLEPILVASSRSRNLYDSSLFESTMPR